MSTFGQGFDPSQHSENIDRALRSIGPLATNIRNGQAFEFQEITSPHFIQALTELYRKLDQFCQQRFPPSHLSEFLMTGFESNLGTYYNSLAADVLNLVQKDIIDITSSPDAESSLQRDPQVISLSIDKFRSMVDSLLEQEQTVLELAQAHKDAHQIIDLGFVRSHIEGKRGLTQIEPTLDRICNEIERIAEDLYSHSSTGTELSTASSPAITRSGNIIDTDNEPTADANLHNTPNTQNSNRKNFLKPALITSRNAMLGYCGYALLTGGFNVIKGLPINKLSILGWDIGDNIVGNFLNSTKNLIFSGYNETFMKSFSTPSLILTAGLAMYFGMRFNSKYSLSSKYLAESEIKDPFLDLDKDPATIESAKEAAMKGAVNNRRLIGAMYGAGAFVFSVDQIIAPNANFISSKLPALYNLFSHYTSSSILLIAAMGIGAFVRGAIFNSKLKQVNIS